MTVREGEQQALLGTPKGLLAHPAFTRWSAHIAFWLLYLGIRTAAAGADPPDDMSDFPYFINRALVVATYAGFTGILLALVAGLRANRSNWARNVALFFLGCVAVAGTYGGITAGLKVSIFLTSAAIDLVRRNGQRLTHVPPLSPLMSLIEDFQKRGGVIWACPPCVTARGYTQEDLLDGVVIVGASAMHAEILEGSATLSF